MFKIMIIIGVLIACIVAVTLLSPSHRLSPNHHIDKKSQIPTIPTRRQHATDINRKIDEERASGHGFMS